MPLHNLMALDGVVCFPNDYQLDCDIFSGLRYHEHPIIPNNLTNFHYRNSPETLTRTLQFFTT